MNFKHVAILLMVFIKCLISVVGLKCYQCRSDLYDHCSNLKNNKRYLLECTKDANTTESKTGGRQPYCRKIIQSLRFVSTETTTIIRECGFIRRSKENYYKTSWLENGVKIYECDTEGCNRESSLDGNVSLWTVILCVFFSIVF